MTSRNDAEVQTEFREADALSDEDMSAIARVVASAFDNWPGHEIGVSLEEHLRWKLDGSRPFQGRTRLASVDGSIVGVGLIGSRLFRIKGIDEVVRYDADVAVHVDYQGQGVYTALEKLSRSEVDSRFVLWVGSASNSVIRSFNPQRRPIGNRIQALAKPRALIPLLRSWGPRAGLVMFRSVRSGIRRTKSLTRPGGAGWTVEPLSEFGDNYEEFFRAAVPQFDCICVRDREYLNWRYIDPRGGWFRSFQALDLMGVILGYVVTKVTESRGIIVDLLALPGRDEIVQALASRAVDELEFAKVPVTTCWLPASHPYQSSLRSLGFVTWYADTLVKYRELREGQQFQELLDDPRTRVHFMEGDLDFV